MTAYYLETSALVKRYKTEPGTPAVDLLIERRKQDEMLVVSKLTIVEVESALARARSASYIDQFLYRSSLMRFALDMDHIFISQEVSDDTFSSAVTLTRRHSLRASDSIHLATVLILQRQEPETVLVASDDELLEAARSEHFRTLNPAQVDALEILRGLRES